jgi:hypothetical protein
LSDSCAVTDTEAVLSAAIIAAAIVNRIPLILPFAFKNSVLLLQSLGAPESSEQEPSGRAMKMIMVPAAIPNGDHHIVA